MLEGDDAAICAAVTKQFAALSWHEHHGPGKEGFLEAFRPEAILVPARRPATPATPTEFVARMEKLCANGLSDFEERLSGIVIRRIGSIAIALAGCEMRENHDTLTRDVSAFLFIKDHGRWSIVAQAWDVVADFAGAGASADAGSFDARE